MRDSRVKPATLVAAQLTIVAVLVIAAVAFSDLGGFEFEAGHSLIAVSKLEGATVNDSFPEHAAHPVPEDMGEAEGVADVQLDCFATITSHVDGERVEQVITVEGVATHGCTTGSSLYLLVASADRTILWPQAGRLILLPTNGTDGLEWFVSAVVGGPDDSGVEFSILVLSAVSGSPAEQQLDHSIEMRSGLWSEDLFADGSTNILDVIGVIRQ